MLVLAVISSQWLVWGCAEHRGGDTEMVLLQLSRADTEPPLHTGEETGGHGKLGGHSRTGDPDQRDIPDHLTSARDIKWGKKKEGGCWE